jgi:protein SCO1/2
VILALAYYNCPMLCTQVFNGLTSSLRVLSFDAGKEFEVVAVSFDLNDRPADARAKRKPYVGSMAGRRRGVAFPDGKYGVDRAADRGGRLSLPL